MSLYHELADRLNRLTQIRGEFLQDKENMSNPKITAFDFLVFKVLEINVIFSLY